MEQYLQVGIISSTHGLKGEVKVYPTTDDVLRFKKLKKVQAETKNGNDELEVENVRFFKNMVILKFKELNSIEDVEKYKSCPLLVSRRDAVTLKPGEYFLCDLMGLAVYEEDGTFLGNIGEIIRTGANDVYVVKKENEKELLIPNIKDCIMEVDLERQQMTVHLLEGLA